MSVSEFSELQGRVDGVNATSRHRDAIDAVAESPRVSCGSRGSFLRRRRSTQVRRGAREDS